MESLFSHHLLLGSTFCISATSHAWNMGRDWIRSLHHGLHICTRPWKFILQHLCHNLISSHSFKLHQLLLSTDFTQDLHQSQESCCDAQQWTATQAAKKAKDKSDNDAERRLEVHKNDGLYFHGFLYLLLPLLHQPFNWPLLQQPLGWCRYSHVPMAEQFSTPHYLCSNESTFS